MYKRQGLLNRDDVGCIYVCTDSGREGEYIYRLVDQMAKVGNKMCIRDRLPTDPEITAPVAGTIAFVFDTKHAIGLVTEQGIGVMIHIGIDTVKLNGKGFDVLVETGQDVYKRQGMMRRWLLQMREDRERMSLQAKRRMGEMQETDRKSIWMIIQYLY